LAHRSLPIVSSSRLAERQTDASRGFTAIELLLAVAVLATVSSIATPPVLRAIDDYRATAAARYMATRLQRARMEALLRTADVAVRIAPASSGYAFGLYVDGNGNGVLSREIASNIDQPLGPAERLGDSFAGVDFGVEPDLPAVDSGSSPPGTDPIRLGASDMASFSPAGTSSSGSLYIRSRTRQLVVRIYGDTAKTRVLVFDRQAGLWKPL